MSQWGVDMGAQGLVVEVLDGSESHGGEFTTGSLEMIRARSKAQQVEGRGIPPLRLRSGQTLSQKTRQGWGTPKIPTPRKEREKWGTLTRYCLAANKNGEPKLPK
jgi:hypothetical protein